MSKKLFLFALLWLLPAVLPAASLTLSIESDTVAVGQGLQLSVRLDGARSLREPRIAGLEGFRVAGTGRSSSTQIVNGQISSSTEFEYYIEPSKPGRYVIGPARIGNLVSNSVRLNVGGSAQSAVSPPAAANSAPLALTASLSKNSCYEGETLEYVLRLFTRVRISDLNINLPPQLNLRQLGDPRQYDRGDQTIVEIRYSFKPAKAGRYRLPPAAVGLRAYVDDDPFFASARPVVLKSQALELNVRPLPGAPAGFSGLSGSFTVQSSLSPKQIKPGEAATYKLMLSGTGTLPALQPSVPAGLKVYPDQPREQGGVKTMSFAVVAERPGIYRLTCPALVYFDTASGSYKRLTPVEQTLTVRGAAVAANLQPLAPKPATPATRPAAEDILPMHVMAERPLALSWALAALFMPLLVYLLLALARHLRASRPASAVKPLTAFNRGFKSNLSRSETLELLQTYFKSRLNLPVSSAAELSAELARRGVAAELAQALTAYVAELDQAVYTGQGATLAGPEIRKLIERLDKEPS